MTATSIKTNAEVKETIAKDVASDPAKVLRMHAAAEQLAAENAKLREELERRNRANTADAEAPLTPQQAFDILKEAWESFFPGKEFAYEKANLANRLAISVTFLGRMKQARVERAQKRVAQADDIDQVGINHGDPGMADDMEIPRVQRDRANEMLSRDQESLLRCKAIQRAAVAYYERVSGLTWEEPENLQERQSRRAIERDARSYHPREAARLF